MAKSAISPTVITYNKLGKADQGLMLRFGIALNNLPPDSNFDFMLSIMRRIELVEDRVLNLETLAAQLEGRVTQLEIAIENLPN